MPKLPSSSILPTAPKRAAEAPTLDARDIALVERMAEVGLGAADIVRCLGWTAADLERYEAVLPQLDEAVARGRSRGKHSVMAVIFAMAVAGDMKAARLYLANHAGWTMRGALSAQLFKLDAKTFAREDSTDQAAGVGVDNDTLAKWFGLLDADKVAPQ